MSSKTLRAGAFASAALLIALFSGAGLSSALAQDQIVVANAPVAAEPTSDLRFVSSPVVQDIPAQQPAASANSLQELVSSIPADSELSAELLCLAQAVYFEARGEELRGQLAVARVVINRATSGQFPDDYCSVVRQRGQFSFVHGGQIPSAETGSTAWRKAVAIARIAHQDLWQSAAGDALYFHAARVNPQWASNRGAVTRIDGHVFYR
jgi:spore germination cell wall hydrolase CwlJ-like protein